MLRLFLSLVLVSLLVVTITYGSRGGGGNGIPSTPTGTSATLAAISVTPGNPSIIWGAKQQFTSTGTHTDSTTKDITTSVTWSSSNPGVATINNAGLATSIAAGSTTITATLGGISRNTTLTVTSGSIGQLQNKTLRVRFWF
jgi:hypothetical protein